MTSFSNIQDEMRQKAPRSKSALKRLVIPNTELTGTNKSTNITVPAGQRWRLHTLFATIATNATTGNRELEARVETSTGVVIWRAWAGSAVGANTSNGGQGWSSGLGADYDTSPLRYRVLPFLILEPGDVIRLFLATGISAGDVVNYNVHYEEI